MRLILKTLIFLLHDERWENLRSHMIAMIGTKGASCVFGVILALICPIMFGIQNVFLGMCLFEDPSKNLTDGFYHVLQSMRYQIVVLYDLSLFRGGNKSEQQPSWPGVFRIIVGYILYTLPICGLMIIFLFAKAEFTLCRSLKANFLLDNDVVPAHNMSILYQERRLWAEKLKNESLENHLDALDYTDGNGGLMWDYQMKVYTPKAYRKEKYWPLENITDLINQFNYVGFHDICIYPRHWYDTSNTKRAWDPHTKGLHKVAHGYGVRNSSGTDYNFTLQ